MAPVELVVSSGPHSAGKATDDCALCDLFGAFNDQQEEEEAEATEEEEEEETTEEEGEEEAPETPTDRYVTATSNDLEWTWYEVAGVDGYRIQYSLDDDLFTEDDPIVELSATKLSYVVADLSPGVTVYLRVQSFVGSGTTRVESAWSTPVAGRTLGQTSDQPSWPDGVWPLWVTYDPPVVRADHAGELSLELLVAGDVEELFFVPFGRRPFQSSTVETWTRATRKHIAGHVVSVFKEKLPSSYVLDFLSTRRRGFFPEGELIVGDLFFARPENLHAFSDYTLRIGTIPMNLPRSRVERIGNTVQYASHVVNLRIPDFGNDRLSNQGLGTAEFPGVTSLFYEHFVDEYVSIGIGHGAMQFPKPPTAGGGFHHSVRDPVLGLGKEISDRSARYGSNGRLRGIQHYTHLSDIHSILIHEIAHTWWDFWDWEGLTGLPNLNNGHGPNLMFPGRLRGGRIIQIDGEDGFMLEERPPDEWGLVWLAEPHMLYRMGLIEAADVPEMLVFEDQDQWQNLDYGDRISGGYRRVDINDIIARHGARQGPVDREWRMAMVVVSRDRLLSEAEMNYWNFVVARQEALVGPPGEASYYQSSDGLARLYTDITPKSAPKIVNDPPLPMSNLPIDSREFPGVQLDEPLPTSIRAGDAISIAGSITHAAFGRATSMCAAWNRRDGYGRYAEVSRECVPVVGGRFSTTFTFTDGDAGIYWFSLTAYANEPEEWPGYGYWPGEILGIEITARAN